MISAMAEGRSLINNILMSADCLVTINILEALGVRLSIREELSGIAYKNNVYHADLISSGYDSFDANNSVLWCGNSGTTARLFAGALAPNAVSVVLDGDKSLRKRPMSRMITPLAQLGADIESVNGDDCLPVQIKKADMYSNEVIGSVASAQVKSAVLLAGLQLSGESVYQEACQTRDHTERILPFFGANVKRSANRIYVKGKTKLIPGEFDVPGDLSSAAVMIACVHMFEGSSVHIHDVGLNPTRTAFLDILRLWGADIDVTMNGKAIEPLGDVTVRYSRLKGGEIKGDLSSEAIDELPLLAVLGLFAENPVIIRDAVELRYKECDRISALVQNLAALGAEVEEYPDGLAVMPLEPSKVVKCALLRSFGDHRIAMINILLAKKWDVLLVEKELFDVSVSYPDFIDDINYLEVK